MRLKFFDAQQESNPLNGKTIDNEQELLKLLESLQSREPFIFELEGENGYQLSIGVANALGCVQHSRADGNSAYLMAVAPGYAHNKGVSTASKQGNDTEGDIEFLMGNTPTPISKRYCMPYENVKDIALYFSRTGNRSPNVCWEEA